MKIILLVGKPNTGKTTTFNLLYDEMVGQNANILKKKSKLGGSDADFECTLIYRNKEVALFSMGDYLNQCTEAIIKYSNKDVLILAYSDKFSTNLKNIIKRYSHHSIVRKTSNNANDVATIISKI